MNIQNTEPLLEIINKDTTQTLDLSETKISETNVQIIEPLLDPSNFRLTTHPIDPKYQLLWNLYKKEEACFWTADEIDFSKDAEHFKTLNPSEQNFIKMVLAFFSFSDGLINFNLKKRFRDEIQILEARQFYDLQIAMENIHSETYSKMLTNIIETEEERIYLFNSIKNIPCLKSFGEWALKWTDSPESFAYRLIAFAIIEGVFFSGAFASIFWLKAERSYGDLFMKGLISSNNFIARDEGMHVNFACVMFAELLYKPPQNDITYIFDEAIEITDKFNKEAINCEMIGMNLEAMNKYTRYVADRLLVYLGYKKMYNVNNPFDFMEKIGLLNKDNFFENRPTTYQKSHNENNGASWKFKILTDF
jgi:ribonucleoside-diphosphate reductase subunit M2